MTRSRLAASEANLLLLETLDLPVSRPWKGYGSAIFLELGKLTIEAGPRQAREKGEATIYVGWDWRVEEGSRVLYGSANSRPKMVDGIRGLLGTRIKRIEIQGQVPELCIEFSSGHRLISAAMCTDVSEWRIVLPDGRWVDGEDGLIYLNSGNGAGNRLTPDEEHSFDHAEQTAARWAVPASEDAARQCQDCQYIVRLDGDAAFLDFGVCTASESPFDGRVINMASGCKAFTSRVSTKA